MLISPVSGAGVQLHVGYELRYSFPHPTPMLLTLCVHHSRAADIVQPDHMMTNPPVPIRDYRDGFGNLCHRMVAPAGAFRIWADAILGDSGFPDATHQQAEQHAIDSLPDDVLVFLLGSRYCETDRFHAIAWDLFGRSPPGWRCVQAICDFVHRHIQFGYEFASPTKTAWDVFNDRRGVCRDFAHLAITLCRSMNIPARYCTGYLTDIGVPPPHSPMDFAGWFEAYVGGGWHVFDPRNNVPRIGRVLVARGRDAADVALNTTFGPNTLESFRVWAEDAQKPWL